jgi:hypothetical protein
MLETVNTTHVRKRRQVRIFSEHNQFRCTTCGQPLHMIRMVDGKPYCQAHAGELAGEPDGLKRFSRQLLRRYLL